MQPARRAVSPSLGNSHAASPRLAPGAPWRRSRSSTAAAAAPPPPAAVTVARDRWTPGLGAASAAQLVAPPSPWRASPVDRPGQHSARPRLIPARLVSRRAAADRCQATAWACARLRKPRSRTALCPYRRSVWVLRLFGRPRRLSRARTGTRPTQSAARGPELPLACVPCQAGLPRQSPVPDPTENFPSSCCCCVRRCVPAMNHRRNRPPATQQPYRRQPTNPSGSSRPRIGCSRRFE